MSDYRGGDIGFGRDDDFLADFRDLFARYDARERERNNPQFDALLVAHHAGVVTDFLRDNWDKIEPDLLENKNTQLRDFDPSVIFQMRALLGPDIFTPKALENVRNNWCRMDLPDPLFDALMETDDDKFLQAVRNAGPDSYDQRGIHGLEKSGYLEKLVQEGNQRRADQARGSVGQPQA